jgi:hypothetical protein
LVGQFTHGAMHLSPIAMCALLTLAATAGGQTPTVTAASTQNAAIPNPSALQVARCPGAASATDNCVPADENTNRLPDLSATQFLFGKDIGLKLSHPSFHSVAMQRVQMADVGELQQAQIKAISPEYAALLRLLVVPTAPVAGVSQARQLTPAEQVAVKAQAEGYLVEEWRQAQLEVADSVHHELLLRIGTTYDSADAAGVTGAARTDLLHRLNDQARTNDYSWYLFRSEVNTRADAARLSNSSQP